MGNIIAATRLPDAMITTRKQLPGMNADRGLGTVLSCTTPLPSFPENIQ